MIPLFRYSLVMLLLLTMLASASVAQNVGSYGKRPMPGEAGPKEPEGVGFVQNLGKSIPKDLVFHDHDNKPVTLEGIANGKPTIVVLAYFRCPKLCSEVIGGLLDGLKELRKKDSSFVAGGPFNVAIISIDPKEPVAQARQRRELFLQDYDGRDVNAPGVWFLTSNEGQGTDLKAADVKVHQLADAIGYRYSLRANEKEYQFTPGEGWKNAAGDPLRENIRHYEYTHSSGIAFISPDGVITRYLLGISYDAFSLRQALIEASGGKVGSFFDRNVAQYCYTYDNVKGHYKLTMRYMGLAAVPFLFGVVAMTIWTIRRARREQPMSLPVPQVPGAAPGTTGLTESTGR